MRTERLLLVAFVMLCRLSAAGCCLPPDSIGTKKIDERKYILHKAEAHEGWFSISRRYKVSYKELKAANKHSSGKLTIGDTVLVPLPDEPLYYTVKQGENLYEVSKKFDTTPDSLKKWNHLKKVDVQTGQRIIIGMRSKVLTVKPAPLPHSIAVDSASPKKILTSNSPSLPAPPSKGIRKDVTEHGLAAWIQDEDINPKKYYALHRTAPVGTLIKVTNKMNQQYVYVKVIGALPDTGDNNDLLIKISKAAAEKLGVRDRKFQCELSFIMYEKN